jgi:hypothetical protein
MSLTDKSLTFSQVEGLAELPRQLELKEVSQALRVELAKVILLSVSGSRDDSQMYGPDTLGNPWRSIMYDKHTSIDGQFPHRFDITFKTNLDHIVSILEYGHYAAIFDFVQFVIRHPECPHRLSTDINNVLVHTRSAYRIVDADTVAPLASDEESKAIHQVFVDLGTSEFDGARQHLKQAASLITTGRWADGVRESVHSVESVVRLVEGSKSVSDAIRKLRLKSHINPNLAKALEALYNYTSDEKGIRHSLLEEGDAKVDEADALFMFGACASFVSYILRKRTD